jgi:hypothetical protein
MNAEDITPGKSYLNQSGRTERAVLHLTRKGEFDWYGSGPKPDEPGVAYQQTRNGKTKYHAPAIRSMCLSSFAKWAESEAPSWAT